MTTTQIIAAITIPADSFSLGQVFEDYPTVSIRLERIVPLQSEIIPLLWVRNDDERAIEATLEQHPHTTIVQSFTMAPNEKLFEVRWDPDLNGIVRAMVESETRLLEAEGTAKEWKFRLRFTSQEDLTAFNQTVTDAGIPITLRRLYNPTMPGTNSELSDKQREAIEQAYHQGHFAVPRKSTVTELADRTGISDSAYSQRLRRGLETLVEETLLTDETTSAHGELDK